MRRRKLHESAIVAVLALSALTGDTAQAGVSTLTYQVSATADDGYAWSTTAQDIGAGYLMIGDDGAYTAPFYMSAMRFTNVAIPRSAAIVTAYLKIRSLNDGTRGQIYGVIQGESVDDAADFASRYIGSAPRTAAQVDWDHKFAWDTNVWQVSGNIAGVVQEIISRPGYNSGNSIAVYYSTRAESGKSRTFGSFESGYGAVLEITYQTYKISGYVKTADAVAISGAVISAGTEIEGAVTDSSGYYELAVPPGWSGMVAVSRAGWGFNPPGREYSSVSSDLANQDYTAFQPKISGYVRDGAGVGIVGVTVSADNGGGSDTTDAGGYYEVTVPYGWSGTVTPAKTGWHFSPASWPYSNIVADQTNQNYTGYQPTISGYVTDGAGAGMAGVSVSADGGGSAVTDDAGYYEIVVPYDWSGTVTPAKAAWGFDPAALIYSNVVTDQTNQNYTAFQPKISGYVRDSAGVGMANVIISADNGGGTDITDASGRYEITVPYNWSGTVLCYNTGWGFNPPSRVYSNVVADQTNQNYTAFQPKISGYVRDGAGIAMPGVTVSANNSGTTDVTDANGYYQVTVPYGWSGKVTPSPTAWGFDPASRSYNNVIADQTNQDYTAFQPTISGQVWDRTASVMAGVTVSADNGGTSDTTDAGGHYEVTVPYGWSGTVTAAKAGWHFSPEGRTYVNVVAHQINQGYVGIQPMITGYVKDTGGAPLAAVSVSSDNGGGSGATDGSGYYEIIVPHDWSGTVTCAKAGWGFNPAGRAYSNVIADQANQDFTAFQPKITGYLTDGVGTAIDAATVSADNAGGSDTSDANGYYEVTVPYGWSGTVTPDKNFWYFEPPTRSYTNVTADTSNQDYVGTAAVRISGHVSNVGGLGVEGVDVSADSGGGSAVTDASGFYEVGVPPGWSGTVTPSKTGRTFWPTHRSYSNLTAALADQTYFAMALTVRADGTGSFPTIQDAIDAAVDGDVVILEPGTFTGPGNRDIDFLGKAITVRSIDPEDPCVVAATIIDCNREGEIGFYGFYFLNNEGPNSILDGLTVTRAVVGIKSYHSSPVIRNCVIKDCSNGGIDAEASDILITDSTITGNGHGWWEHEVGGIYAREGGILTVTNCTISNNRSHFGGGIHCYGLEMRPEVDVTGCTFTGNSGVEVGGAMNRCWGRITNCVFIGNEGPAEGGALRYCTGPITDCTFTDNHATQNGGALYHCAGPVTNCTFTNNQAGDAGGAMYSCAGAITNSTFTGNQATNGGGALSACTGETTNCTFTANQAANAGGALHYCTGQITNCTFIANQAGGAGGAMYKCSRRVTSSVFSSNRAGSNGGAIYIVHPWGYELGLGLWNCTLSGNSAGAYGGGIFSEQSGPTLTNCVVWGNSDSSGSGESAQIYTGAAHVTFSCIQDDDPNDANIPFGGADANNIDDDPMFVRDPNDGGDGWGDDPCTPDVNEAANDDYGDLHLRYDSPCIDGGDPFTWLGSDGVDMDGETRIMGGWVDMGADEYFVPWITVFAPQAGDVWAAGSWHEIEWQSYAVAGTVDISYSDDNGGEWTTIDSDVPNTGSYLWELPLGVDSNECLVSVVPSTPDPNVILIESRLFTIHPDTPGADVPARWRSLGGDFDRAGLSDTYGPELGCLKWQFDAGGPVAGSVTVGKDNRVHIACEGGELYTLDANGALLRSYDTNSPLLSSPTIGPDGTVYVGSEDGTLFAIDIDGGLRWTHTAGDFIYASPAVSADGNTVFVGSGEGVLYALGRDGSELWSFETTGFGVTTGAIFASPAIGIDGTVYVGAVSDPNLYALDPNDGSVKWVCRFEFWRRPQQAHLGPELGWPFTSPVVATDGTIYQKSLYDPNLYAIDPDSGDIIWSLDCGDGWSEPVLGPDGTIYAGQADSNLLAIDPNGGVKWTRRLGTAGGLSMTVGNDGLLYAAGYDGYFGVIDPNGEELARFQSDTWLFAPVIAADGTVIVSDGSDRVLAIGADDCEQEVLLLHRLEDLDGSGWVNFKDFALLAMDWLACNDLAGPCYGEAWDGTYFIGDVDRNRYVDWLDVAALADRWLAGE